MPNLDRLDKKIITSLQQRAEKIEASDGLTQRVMANIRLQNKEAYTMKKVWNMKRIIVAAAAFTILGSVGVFAGSVLKGSIITTSSNSDVVKTYKEAKALPEELGYKTAYGLPEALGGGFLFESAGIGNQTIMDESGKASGEATKTLYASYLNQEENRLDLNISKSSGMEAGLLAGDATKEVNGVTLKYTKDNYLLLADETALTEEDKAAMANEELVVSYGGDAIESREEMVYENVYWTKDGVEYILLAQDSDLGEEAMFNMAEQWMAAK